LFDGLLFQLFVESNYVIMFKLDRRFQFIYHSFLRNNLFA